MPNRCDKCGSRQLLRMVDTEKLCHRCVALNAPEPQPEPEPEPEPKPSKKAKEVEVEVELDEEVIPTEENEKLTN